MCFASKFVYVCVYIFIYIYIVRCNYDIQFLSAIFDIYKMTTKYINIYHFFTPPSNLPKTTKGHTLFCCLVPPRKRDIPFESRLGVRTPPTPRRMPPALNAPRRPIQIRPGSKHRHRVTPHSWRKFFKHDAWNYQIYLDFPLPVFFWSAFAWFKKSLCMTCYLCVLHVI